MVIGIFLGFFWGRGGFVGCWHGGNNIQWFGKRMMWGGNVSWFDDSNNWWDDRNWPRNGSSKTGYSLSSADVLSIEEAEMAVDAFIAEYSVEEALSINEVMIFDNHA